MGGVTGKGKSRDGGPEVDGVCSTEASTASEDRVLHKESARSLLNAKGLEQSLAHRGCLLNAC